MCILKKSARENIFFCFIYCPCSVRFGQRHGRLCNIAKVWTLSTLLGDCPTLMDSHLHNLKGGTYVSKKLVGRSIPRLAKKAFHSNGVTLTSPPLQQTQLLQCSSVHSQSSHCLQTQSLCCLASQRPHGLLSLILFCNLSLITLHKDLGQITQSG